MSTVVITPEPLQDQTGEYIDLLRAAGFEVVFPAQPILFTERETIGALRGASAVIAGGEPYTDSVFSELPDLRVISRCGVGYDMIDVEAASRHGVVLAITPDGNCEAVAEHTFSLMLAVARRVTASDREVRRGLWLRTSLIPLRGQTLGIVGLGRIGRAVATRALAFGMNVLAFDLSPPDDFIRRHGIELTDLRGLLTRSDFVTLHVPANKQTHGLINCESISWMKRGAYLINTARGGLVIEGDLAEALRSGQIGGAGLDVLAAEPPSLDNPLLSFDNVVFSAHLAANDTRALADMPLQAARNIIDLVAGRWPNSSIVNPEVAPHWSW